MRFFKCCGKLNHDVSNFCMELQYHKDLISYLNQLFLDWENLVLGLSGQNHLNKSQVEIDLILLGYLLK